MSNESVVFIDTEIGGHSGQILDYGAIRNDGAKCRTRSGAVFHGFIKDAAFLCGHNIVHHDLEYIKQQVHGFTIAQNSIIDTLFWSPLLFPRKPYHRLIKDDKLIPEDINNPVSDAIKSRDLLYDEIHAFNDLPEELRNIFYSLLGGFSGFAGFFRFISFSPPLSLPAAKLIRSYFSGSICSNCNLDDLILFKPIELAYSLAIINANDRDSITPPWVLKTFPETVEVIQVLRDTPCIQDCTYCSSVMNPVNGLKKYFGFSEFRKFGGEPLQEQAVKAAVDNKSILAVFPTGGGKSLAFQLPALISGETVKGLTVVISPLQSLMKDQVDNLENKKITEAVAVSGLLDPIERQDALNRVVNGSASILYIAPESLRTASIRHRLIGRNIVRFVIDEAHCFSAWGHDFRVDYMYIGRFIKELQEDKGLSRPVPVSCFTATAKRKVIEDIRAYFKAILDLDLELFTTDETRQNLYYKVIEVKNDRDKFFRLREILERYDCPSIVYVARTKKAEELAYQLGENGINALPFHGRMDRDVKTRNQEAFMAGDVNTMVATSAFGMGVDKDNIGLIIHYDISDSLENYIQEAGRAGRDFSITADCYILFNDDDLAKHFHNHNRQKVHIKEIQQVWRAIRTISRMREKISYSALELAREAGWEDDTGAELETRVLTVLSALEMARFIKRDKNNPRIYANSIQVRSADEAINIISGSERFSDKEREYATRIIKALISSRSRKRSSDELAESRIDYLSDNLGIRKEEVVRTVMLLREEKILADSKDMRAFIFAKDSENGSLSILEIFAGIEKFLFTKFRDDVIAYSVKDLNEEASVNGCTGINPRRIKTLTNFWTLRNWVEYYGNRSGDHMLRIRKRMPDELTSDKIQRRHETASFIIRYLFRKPDSGATGQGYRIVEFSILELKNMLKTEFALFKDSVSVVEIEDTLLYLSRIGAIKIDGAFFVIYNRLTIERLQLNNRIQYKSDDYRQLEEHYANKVQQIHIVGEYAKKMLHDYSGALAFVDDYFRLNYSSFLSKYFPGTRGREISKTITPARYKELMDVSPAQKTIIEDDHSETIVVAAGPGSGKTRLLIHKIASLVMLEQFKIEHILVLTFSRAAATEFQKRLQALMGTAAYYVEIRTFHSFCFDLYGITGTVKKSENVVKEATERIKNREAEPGKLIRSVLVIDEAQDMSAAEYELILSIAEYNEGIKIIAVGDDDQNIFEFRGSDSKYFYLLAKRENSSTYELIDNFRSAPELVDLTNFFAGSIKNRLKNEVIRSASRLKGQIRIVSYRSNNLYLPVSGDILKTSLTGSTALLTHTNDQAATLTALLSRMGARARLIQSNDDFNLYNLKEFRWFCDYFKKNDDDTVIPVTISDDEWKESLNEFRLKHGESQNYELCIRLINEFDEINKRKKYYSDLRQYFLEARFDDVLETDTETIYVSTFHKSKGREFENVFIMLENYKLTEEDQKRALYVAMTRAKKYLAIHHNGTYFNRISLPVVEHISDPVLYDEPSSVVIRLTHADVYLDYFKSLQMTIGQITAGVKLKVDETGCYNKNGLCVIRFSESFRKILASFIERGYSPESATVNYSVYWKPKDSFKEYLILLPEIVLSRG
ncbi:MAG TPA: RecQ family ATP-dependent DNA helicase [Bacteroidales bacterium]|jgi:ATP-dependent DNA helicase RecQ|nr:RecQ family ATP-dependent DNA helicase [Bacteroidales bacterium]HQH24353.1 RecQ family ATP-dependent DNA helicase [Bacteroidales bacterium]HQK70656.1 RecQ family ATP-dependent DNA helicase [Bacteroidales bacterium]